MVQVRAMRPMSIATGVVAGVVVMPLVLAGCTGIGSDAKTSTPVEAPKTAKPKGDGTLVIGTLLPMSGENAGAYQGTIEAVKIAVAEVNSAGGVNGKPVTVVNVDAAKPDAVQQLTTKKVDVAIGNAPASLADALVAAKIPNILLDPISGDVKPSKGYTFQYGASPQLLAAALPQAVAKASKKAVGVLAPDSDPGKAQLEALTTALAEAKLAMATDPVLYTPGASNLTVAVTKAKSANPDSIIALTGNMTGPGIIGELNMQRLGPANVPLYVTGINTKTLEAQPAGSITGLKTVQSGAQVTPALRERLSPTPPPQPSAPSATQGATGAATEGASASPSPSSAPAPAPAPALNGRDLPEAYDAVITAALAASAGKDDDGTVLGENLPAVTSDGKACNNIKACAGLLAKGDDINYEGFSGGIDLGEEGVRRAGVVAVFTGDDQSKMVLTDYLPSKTA